MIFADITWSQIYTILCALAAGATIAGVFVSWIIGNRKIIAKVDQEPVPEIRKASPRYNHPLVEQRFSSLEGRVTRHEGRIDKIEDMLRVDLPAMERRMDTAGEKRISDVHDRVNQILEAVGELRGELRAKK